MSPSANSDEYEPLIATSTKRPLLTGLIIFWQGLRPVVRLVDPQADEPHPRTRYTFNLIEPGN
jgi:hypothetical protein